MKTSFHILIADRNPHVREFLRREMLAEGYQVRLAENGRELSKWAFHNEKLDLVIVDPDLPDIDVPSLLKKLKDRIPFVPIVVHTFMTDYTEYALLLQNIPVVEKRGSSIERLKKLVFEILHQPGQRQGASSPGVESGPA